MHIDVPSFPQPSKELLQLGGKGEQSGAVAYRCMRLHAVDAGQDRHASTQDNLPLSTQKLTVHMKLTAHSLAYRLLFPFLSLLLPLPPPQFISK